MKIFLTSIITLFFLGSIHASRFPMEKPGNCDTIPAFMKGSFEDDYGIQYKIADSLWTQLPAVRYHIISWNVQEQYLIVRNDNNNPSEADRFTRIDVMSFDGMAPFQWGFCLTRYDAVTQDEAEKSAAADRNNPRKGCNGYPFSRMKLLDRK